MASVADPGFPVGGGMDLVGGGVDSRGSYISWNLYVKTKELGPLGGHTPGAPPKSANGLEVHSLAGISIQSSRLLMWPRSI